MRPAFEGSADTDPIKITVSDYKNPPVTYVLKNANVPYSQWECSIQHKAGSDMLNIIKKFQQSPDIDLEKFATSLKVVFNAVKKAVDESSAKSDKENHGKSAKNKRQIQVNVELPSNDEFAKFIVKQGGAFSAEQRVISNFVIYSPENSALRVFEREGQIEPLGINGEGLLKLLSVMSESDRETLSEIKASLKVFGWFEGFEIVHDARSAQERMEIKDLYLANGRFYNDQKSTNEGFLFLTFYFALFSSNLTPKFFAIDNVDASLNPRLCARMTRCLVEFAVAHDKQVLLTTHSPAVLDGLNLDDENQRLFIVSRGANGQTRVRRFKKPPAIKGASPVKLSEAFLRGSLGGLPKGF